MGWFIAGGVAAVLGVVYVWASRRSTYRRPDQVDATTTQAMSVSDTVLSANPPVPPSIRTPPSAERPTSLHCLPSLVIVLFYSTGSRVLFPFHTGILEPWKTEAPDLVTCRGTAAAAPLASGRRHHQAQASSIPSHHGDHGPVPCRPPAGGQAWVPTRPPDVPAA